LNQDYTPFTKDPPVNRISSPWTRFIKWASPLAWLGALAYFAVDSARGQRMDLMLFGIVTALAVVGLLLMKFFLWNLADEVYDCGDSLLVRRGGIEESVPLAGITEVALALFSRPPRITLKLARPGKFGSSIVFTPPTSPGLELFGRNPIAEDLKAKVQRAR
jgi:hypothetical protein